MNRNILQLALIGIFAVLSNNLPAQLVTLDIGAVIDGRDQLIIQGNTLQWHHFDWAAVGRHWGANAPTTISTALNGIPLMDQMNWIPQWPSLPPHEIRYEAFSSTFSLSGPAITQGYTLVALDILQARLDVNLIQLPTAANDYTTILEFNDNKRPSDSFYEARLTFATIPEPSVAALGLLFAASASLFLRSKQLPK